ncbi:DUF262 domain-containing protein [Undibacterium sp.]|uniref:DUF262 domain-containing protein n=1 Tax=Undibacterium sp. TaxID=1914977 RepID=UPI0025D3C5AD|nr:DUF262 domain-containing protein [Undibacterium sp.]
MNANESKLQPLIEGTKQYLVPLFQRPYSWDTKEWKILWEDLKDLSESEGHRPHFFGSIVTMPTVSLPEGVTKYLLIDGQQRLTTSFILLALIRNLASENGHEILSQQIANTLLLNPYNKENDRFKLLPTQDDRFTFIELVEGRSTLDNSNKIAQAYRYFEKNYKKSPIDLEKFKSIVLQSLSVVSVVLDLNDNPQLVFEGLNAKGKPLTQSDLIRNYFVMRVHSDKQEEIYKKYWKPLEEKLGDQLTEFIRHFLMKDGARIKLSDVFVELKDQVNVENAISYLEDLSNHAVHYKKFILPEFETDADLRAQLQTLNRLDIGVCYPFLLNCFESYRVGELNKSEIIRILQTVQTYAVRRFVCAVPSHGLNKIFPVLFKQAKQTQNADFPKVVEEILASKSLPRDNDFRSKLIEAKLYGNGDRTIKTKIILEAIEKSYEHKEKISLGNLTVEHIMPQTLTQEWEDALGENKYDIHETYLHTIGNLTLSGYNSELSNSNFQKKRNLLIESHLEINKYFVELNSWSESEIKKRSELLVERCLTIWPYFGTSNVIEQKESSVSGTTPQKLKIFGQEFKVLTWRDVLQTTVNTLIELEPDKYELLKIEFPKLVASDAKKLRENRPLINGNFLEVNHSATSIKKICENVIMTCGLDSEDWEIFAV